MGPDWAPSGLAHFRIILNQPKYESIDLNSTELKRCLVAPLDIDSYQIFEHFDLYNGPTLGGPHVG